MGQNLLLFGNGTENMVNQVNTPPKELGLKAIFKFIFSALFLIFFAASGIASIKNGQLVIGILFFVLSALIFVPHRFLRITQPLKWVILIIFYIVLLGMSGRSLPPKEQKYEYFNLGQQFNLVLGNNTFSMTVQKTQTDNKIIAKDKEVTTSGHFLIVKTEVVNPGSEAADFRLSTDPKLTDGQNRIYTLYGAKIPESKLQPSVSKEVSYVFEIPKDASGLKFIIKDKTGVAKSVDLKR